MYNYLDDYNLLLRILADHLDYLEDRTTGRCANFAGCNFSRLPENALAGANLQDANFAGAQLFGMNLTRVNFKNANFKGAELNHAFINDANLWGANFTAADFEDAAIINTDLSNACFVAANLKYADLSGSDIDSTDFTHAQGTWYACFDEVKGAEHANFFGTGRTTLTIVI